MRQSTRLILNASATFVRMAVNIGLGLLTTRLLIQQLGHTDYGLLIAISASVGMMTVLTLTMRISAGRRAAIIIGQGDDTALKQVFSSTVAIHGVMALIVVGLASLLGPLVLDSLTIPSQRMDIAHWVYAIYALNLAISVLFLPYEIILFAKQEIVVTSVFQIVDAVFKLAAACILIFADSDLLLLYAVLFTVCNFIMLGLRALTCRRRVPAARFKTALVSKQECTEIALFGRWTLLQTAGNYARVDANVLLINIAFGTTVNAIYAVGQQLAIYIQNFTMAIEGIVLPASLKSEGAGNRAQAIQVSFLGEKYTLLLLSFIVLPILIETPMVIRLWLGEASYDPAMVEFSQLLIAWTSCSVFSKSYSSVLFGQGNWGPYSTVQLLVAIAILALGSLCFFVFSLPSLILPCLMLIGAIAFNAYRIVYIGKELNIKISTWLKEVPLPLLKACGPPALLAIACHLHMEPSGLRLFLVAAIYTLFALPLIWLLGISAYERDHFKRVLLSVTDKLKN